MVIDFCVVNSCARLWMLSRQDSKTLQDELGTAELFSMQNKSTALAQTIAERDLCNCLYFLEPSIDRQITWNNNSQYLFLHGQRWITFTVRFTGEYIADKMKWTYSTCDFCCLLCRSTVENYYFSLQEQLPKSRIYCESNHNDYYECPYIPASFPGDLLRGWCSKKQSMCCLVNWLIKRPLNHADSGKVHHQTRLNLF